MATATCDNKTLPSRLVGAYFAIYNEAYLECSLRGLSHAINLYTYRDIVCAYFYKAIVKHECYPVRFVNKLRADATVCVGGIRSKRYKHKQMRLDSMLKVAHPGLTARSGADW